MQPTLLTIRSNPISPPSVFKLTELSQFGVILTKRSELSIVFALKLEPRRSKPIRAKSRILVFIVAFVGYLGKWLISRIRISPIGKGLVDFRAFSEVVAEAVKTFVRFLHFFFTSKAVEGFREDKINQPNRRCCWFIRQEGEFF